MSQTFDELAADIASLAASLEDLHRQAMQALAPVVEQLVRTRSRDVAAIEHTLDSLLGHAGDPAGLALFKSLCRHYYSFDPQAAAEYVMIYQKQWDSEETEVEA